MKTATDILNQFYSIVNTATITGISGGTIYRIEKPLNSTSKDIVLRPLSVNGNNRLGVQSGTLMINCFAENHLKTGRPNESYLDSITDAVISQLENYASASTSYLTYDIVSQNILPDDQNEKMCFSNIRVDYWIQTS
jgi:hypothetical protein